MIHLAAAPFAQKVFALVNLSWFSKRAKKTSTLPAPLPTQQPIMDQRYFIENELSELAYKLGMHLEELESYQLLRQAVENPEKAHFITLSGPGFEEYVLPDNLTQMVLWVRAAQLPNDFRVTLVHFVMTFDDLEEQVRSLSHTRWEQLRVWIHERR